MRRAVLITITIVAGTLLSGLTLGSSSVTDADEASAPAAVFVCSECAYESIQDAVDDADDDDVIKVASGVYTGVQSRPAPPGYDGPSVITQVVYVSKTITIRGGYTITNWTTPYPITQPTTVDAQGQGRVICVTGDITPVIEGLANHWW